MSSKTADTFQEAKGEALETARSLAVQVRSYFSFPRCPRADDHLLDLANELLAQLVVLEALDLEELVIFDSEAPAIN